MNEEKKRYGNLIAAYLDTYRDADGWPTVYTLDLQTDQAFTLDCAPDVGFFRSMEDAGRVGAYLVPDLVPVVIKLSYADGSAVAEEMTRVARGEAFSLRVATFSTLSALSQAWGRSHAYLWGLCNGNGKLENLHWRALEAEEARRDIRPMRSEDPDDPLPLPTDPPASVSFSLSVDPDW